MGINPLISPPSTFPSPPLLFLSPPDPGANQQLFVHCHLTNDSSGGERKATWGVSGLRRAGVTASERRGGWRKEEVGEERRGEGGRATQSESITRETQLNQSGPPFLSLSSLLSAFLFHSPHRTSRLLCLYLPASGAALAVTGHCGWMCVRNASAWLYMSTEQLCLCCLPVYTHARLIVRH